jgi:hypothetical protein
MGWLRSNRGSIAWLAFFALACQLLLSFGHVHLANFDGGSTAWALADGTDGSAAIPQSPQNNPPGLAGDFCAICANIGLAGTLVVPDAPVVVAPNSFIEVLRWPVLAFGPAGFDRLAFNARGPPQA